MAICAAVNCSNNTSKSGITLFRLPKSEALKKQ